MNASNPRTRNIIAWSVMLVMGALWGGTLPLTKVAVSTGHGPLGLIFWQLLISVIVLGLVLLFRGWRPQFSRSLMAFFTVIAFIGTILPNGFSYTAAFHLPAGVMSIAIALVPMFTLLLAVGLKLESPSLRRSTGVLLGFTAMVLIAAPQTGLPEPEKAIFLLVALVAPFFYGLEANYIALKTPAGTDPVSTLFMASLIGMFLTAPVSLLSGQWINPLEPWASPEYALVVASVIHAVTYCGYIWLVGFGGPVFSVQMAYPVTLSGVFLSVWFLGEIYSGWVWAALVLVIVGLVLVQPRFKELETENGDV